jgi:hypothetical protein
VKRGFRLSPRRETVHQATPGFGKTRVPTPTAAPVTEATPRISPSELTIFGVASALIDPAERAAYLDRACGADDLLRIRLEERLAERFAAREPQPAPAMPANAQLVPSKQDKALATQERPDALALVPMSAMQFAAAQQPPRHSPIPWAAATLMAIAVGALAVFFLNERTARESAERTSKEAAAARLEAERARDSAKTSAEETGKKNLEVEREKHAATTAAEQARQEAARNRTELDEAQATLKTANEKAAAAQAEVAKLRNDAVAGQQATAIALADSLARLGAFQLDAKAYAEAETSIRQSLQIRLNSHADGWTVLESRALLGSILLQKNQDAEAQQEVHCRGHCDRGAWTTRATISTGHAWSMPASASCNSSISLGAARRHRVAS